MIEVDVGDFVLRVPAVTVYNHNEGLGDTVEMAQKKDWKSWDPWLLYELPDQLGIIYFQSAVN